MTVTANINVIISLRSGVKKVKPQEKARCVSLNAQVIFLLLFIGIQMFPQRLSKAIPF
jgi:hypothetical protein